MTMWVGMVMIPPLLTSSSTVLVGQPCSNPTLLVVGTGKSLVEVTLRQSLVVVTIRQSAVASVAAHLIGSINHYYRILSNSSLIFTETRLNEGCWPLVSKPKANNPGVSVDKDRETQSLTIGDGAQPRPMVGPNADRRYVPPKQPTARASSRHNSTLGSPRLGRLWGWGWS
ncbi:hypothetical protein Syun_001421 [Stephania yunnanensis]|uniref:Secreted protein n=1 Tax=Stephania yunnanensis TaxID=152371 RepID=A0AAP0LDW6_9MAGN